MVAGAGFAQADTVTTQIQIGVFEDFEEHRQFSSAFISARRTASMPAAHARASALVEKLADRETSPSLTCA